CDLKFKSSKNQRLLVELTLMQLASITHDGEKKNSGPYIIPASYFRKKGITPVPVNRPSATVTAPPQVQEPQEEKLNPRPKAAESTPYSQQVIPKINLKLDTQRTSGLS